MVLPIPKVVGGVDLKNARLIVLLDVIYKATYGHRLEAHYVSVREENDLLDRLDPNRFGNRAGLMRRRSHIHSDRVSELATTDQGPLTDISTNISRCYDSISFGIKERALRRLGVPRSNLLRISCRFTWQNAPLGRDRVCTASRARFSGLPRQLLL